MKNHDFLNTSAPSQLSVNDIIRNLFKLLAFKYKSHDVTFTRLTDQDTSREII